MAHVSSPGAHVLMIVGSAATSPMVFWLRHILARETEEARELLRLWQEKVLAWVQSTQLDSAAVLPLLLQENAEDARGLESIAKSI